MLHDLIELVDRQFHFLEKQEAPEDFVLQLAEVLNQLASEPRLGAILQALHAEARAALMKYQASEEASVQELTACREKLASLAPDVAAMSAAADINNHERFSAHGPLAFDRLAMTKPGIGFSKDLDDRDDPARTPHLAKILAGMLDDAMQKAPDASRQSLEEIVARNNALSDLHDHDFREFWRTARTNAGVALGRLVRVANALNPAPRRPASEDGKEMLEWGLREILSGNFSVREAVFDKNPTHEAKAKLVTVVQSLRGEARKLHEALRSRIGLRDRAKIT